MCFPLFIIFIQNIYNSPVFFYMKYKYINKIKIIKDERNIENSMFLQKSNEKDLSFGY